MSLSADDLALCAREPDLPGLAAVLNAPTLAQQAGLSPMRQAYLRYKAGTSCVAGLIAEDGKTAWSAMTYPAERYADVRARSHWANKAIFLDDIQVVLMPLQLDRRLRGARAVADPDKRIHLLERLGLEDCTLHILRYKAGRRIVLRADDATGPCAIVKLHADKTAFDAALSGVMQSGKISPADQVVVSYVNRAIAVSWIKGNMLSPTACPSSFVEAGRALAVAHATPVHASLDRWVPQDPAALATSRGALLPDLAPRADRLATELPALPKSGDVALHGDFSPDQVLIGPSGAQIVDWDRAACGNPARDLGSFLAALDLAQILGAPTETADEALLAGYEASGGIIDEPALQSHRAHALFALARDGFRARRPDWAQETRAVLDKTHALLSKPQRRVVPGLSDALKPDVMQSRIEAAAGQVLSNAGPELVRLKPGRRALVRYALQNGHALLGKLRAKGPDWTAPHVQGGLRAAGLDGRDGVGVPAVVGAVENPSLWLQAEVPGAPLGALLKRPNALRTLRRVGRALATLHNTAPQTTRPWRMASELDVLRRHVEEGPYSHLDELATNVVETLPPGQACGLHRDFYYDQVMVDETTVWLVDLDLHAIGDPAIDVGNFLAHLIELGLRRAGDVAHFNGIGNAFLDGYASIRSLPPSERIDALVWVSLARHVTIARRFPDRRHTIPAIAAFCQTQLSRQLSAARVAM